MYQSSARSLPNCPKCEKPMAWHSTQMVNMPEGEERLQIFQCQSCAKFVAIEEAKAAA